MILSIKTPPKMALNFPTLPPNLHTNPSLSSLSTFKPPHLLKFNHTPRKPLKISCSKEKENTIEETLEKELALEIKKLNTQTNQTQEALKKSRELLFSEICNFTGLNSKSLKKKWDRMNEDEKLVMAKGFLEDWSAHFHPLSAKAVKGMVERYLHDEEISASFSAYPNFRKFLGNSQGW